MTQSESEHFVDVVEKIGRFGLLSTAAIESCLEEFGGVQGAISQKYYISASELIGWEIAKKANPSKILDFFTKNENMLASYPAFMYYFVEAVVDQLSAIGVDIKSFIAFAPRKYQPFLKRRFLGGN